MRSSETAYKIIIDELVARSKVNCYKNIQEKGCYSNGVDAEPYNKLIQSMTQDEREVLVNLLNETSQGAIHSVLELLTWWISCKGLSIHHEGKELEVDLSGMGLNGDYIGRLKGWKWPDEE